MTSVNTNFSALVALQNLTKTGNELSDVQQHISTGLKVGSAKDNGAVFAIAEGLRTRVGALASVSDGLDRATTAIDTALAAGSSIGDVLKQLKQKAIDAQTLTAPSDRQKAQADFAALRNSIDSFVNAATINGVNLVNGTNATTGLSVLTTDVGGGSASVGAAIEGRGTTSLTNATATAVAPLTTNTLLVGTQGSGNLGAIAGGKVSFTLADPTGGSNTQVYNVTLSAGQSVADFIKGVSDASGGKVTATLDATNNRLVYSSAQTFTVGFTSGGDGTLTTAQSTSEQELGSFFGAASFSASGASGSIALTTTVGASSTYQLGGGYQLAAGTAQASGTTLTSKVTDLVNTNDGTGKLTFVVGAQAASQRTFNVSVNGLNTLSDFINAVGQQTNGQVTAAYDSVTRKIVYKASEAFTVTANAAAGVKFGPASATAGTAAPTIGGAAAGSGAGATSTVSGFDFRVNGGSFASLASLDLTTDPTTAGSTVQSLLDTLNTNLAQLGGQSKALASQKTFLQSLSDNIDKGVGLLVDADLAKESARLQALQVKQQLGAQALSIANQSPQILLSFFR